MQRGLTPRKDLPPRVGRRQKDLVSHGDKQTGKDRGKSGHPIRKSRKVLVEKCARAFSRGGDQRKKKTGGDPLHTNDQEADLTMGLKDTPLNRGRNNSKDE